MEISESAYPRTVQKVKEINELVVDDSPSIFMPNHRQAAASIRRARIEVCKESERDFSDDDVQAEYDRL